MVIDDLPEIPSHDQDPAYYSGGAGRPGLTTGDLRVREWACEVVAPIAFELAAAERGAFEAQLKLESGEPQSAARIAYESMLHAALALVKEQYAIAGEDPEAIVAEFRKHFYDTQLFFDPFTGGKFAQYFFDAHEKRGARYDEESAHYLIEQAQLFIEAAHSCYSRMAATAATA